MLRHVWIICSLALALVLQPMASLRLSAPCCGDGPSPVVMDSGCGCCLSTAPAEPPAARDGCCTDRACSDEPPAPTSPGDPAHGDDCGICVVLCRVVCGSLATPPIAPSGGATKDVGEATGDASPAQLTPAVWPVPTMIRRLAVQAPPEPDLHTRLALLCVRTT